MHRHYATLYDHAYSAKGLALYESLVKHSSEPFTLHILAMDDVTLWILDSMDLPHVQVIPYRSFESTMKMAAVKHSREPREYFWTCASVLMEYMLRFPQIDQITYLDADVFFFSDPKQIFDEMQGRSIGITPHRFNENTPAHVLNNGRFNVGIVVANNDDAGRDCITRWAAQVREWCYDRREGEHQCGDQKYLDEWPIHYWDSLAILEHPGINLGPWAVGNYAVEFLCFKNQRGMDEIGVCVDNYPLVAYHFHEFKNPDKLTNWPLRMIDIALIYKPYIEEWKKATLRIDFARHDIEERRQKQELQAERV
jgi:hypothetical protein